MSGSRPPRYKYPRLSTHGIPDGDLASACDEAGFHPGMSPRSPRSTSTRGLHTPYDSAQQLIERGQVEPCDPPAGRRFAGAMPKTAMPTRGRRALLHLEARSTPWLPAFALGVVVKYQSAVHVARIPCFAEPPPLASSA
jgi:hypothetical protein